MQVLWGPKLAAKWQKINFWPVLVMSLCLISAPGYSASAAEQLALSTEQDFLGEIAPVLSATRLAQPRSDAPAAVTVIDREMIEASGATEIVDVIRLAPGFQLAHEPGDMFIANPVGVTYHGLSDVFARRLQVLIDGRSIYSPDFGGVRWNELPLSIDDVERIEIIRGPNAASYGANSFMAVVNIKTRHPADVHGVYTGMTLGGNNEHHGLVRYAAGNTNNDYRVSVGYKDTDAFVNQVDTSAMRFANLRSEHRLSNVSKIEVLMGIGAGYSQVGDGGNDNPYRDSGLSRNFQQILWTYSRNPDSEYRLHYYRNYNAYVDVFDAHAGILPPLPPNTRADLGVTTERNNIEFQHIYRWNESLRTVWGAETRVDQVQANAGWFYGLGTIRNNLNRVFANAEWRLAPEWVGNFGLMVEDNGITGVGISPRVGFNYHLSPGHTVRASVSQGLRTPSLLEAYAYSIIELENIPPPPTALAYYYGSAANINPEKITSYELGYLYESRLHNLNVDFRLFKDYFSDLIVYPDNMALGAGYVPVGPSYQFQNGGTANISGFEVDLRFRPTRKSRLVFSYAYAVQDGIMLEEINPNKYTSIPQATPEHTVSFLGIYKLTSDLTASVGAYYVGQTHWLDNTLPKPEYNKVDVRLAKKLEATAYGGTLEFIGQNMSGGYYDHAVTNVFDKRVFVRLRLQTN